MNRFDRVVKSGFKIYVLQNGTQVYVLKGKVVAVRDWMGKLRLEHRYTKMHFKGFAALDEHRRLFIMPYPQGNMLCFIKPRFWDFLFLSRSPSDWELTLGNTVVKVRAPDRADVEELGDRFSYLRENYVHFDTSDPST